MFSENKTDTVSFSHKRFDAISDSVKSLLMLGEVLCVSINAVSLMQMRRFRSQFKARYCISARALGLFQLCRS